MGAAAGHRGPAASGGWPSVALFSLGGTIAMSPRRDGAGVAPSLGAAELLAAVPDLAESPVTLSVTDVRNLPGASLGIPDLLDLAGRVEAAVAAGVVGMVVTQGTDTIEETAYLLDLLHGSDAPVVVTGAMRHPGQAGADGPANLLAAVQTAACATARGLGALVVFNDEIHAARWVRKTHTTSTAAFTSPSAGPIGHVIEGEVRVHVRPERYPALSGVDGRRPVRVALLTTALDDDGSLLRLAAGHFDGFVIAAFGAGHVPAAGVPVLADVAAGKPVVLASRTGAGRVLERTYGFPGSERDLLDRGLISAGYLDPAKARVLLHLLLSAGADTDEIRREFATRGGTGGPPA
jgi:L-asparaginase